jgi:hypothetical protein
VIGSPPLRAAYSQTTYMRSHMHALPVQTPIQLPILVVLLFSTLCLFLVAEAKNLYKVRGV